MTTVVVATVVLAAGCGPSHPSFYGVRRVPPTPSVVLTSTAYPYYLYIHCGIRYAQFANQWWEADTPEPAPTAAGANTEAYGTITLLDLTHARFQGKGAPTVDFHPYPSTPPACS